MSFEATSWAMNQEDLSPHAWRVLVILADCYDPSQGGCHISQGRIATKTNMSRSGLNIQLRHLEKAGLISRKRRQDETTNQQLSTFYYLGFENHGDKSNLEEKVQ